MKKIIIVLTVLIAFTACEEKAKKGLEDSLVVAINGNNIEEVKKELEKEGTDVDFRLNKNVDTHHRTPLAWAAYTNLSTLEGIVGIEIGKKAEKEKEATPGRVEIVKYLLEKGADCKIKDDKNWTPLAWAAWSGFDTISEVLAEKCQNINEVTKKKWSPLMIASMRGWDKVVTVLLMNNADRNLKNEDDLTALDIAKKYQAIYPAHSERYNKTVDLLTNGVKVKAKEEKKEEKPEGKAEEKVETVAPEDTEKVEVPNEPINKVEPAPNAEKAKEEKKEKPKKEEVKPEKKDIPTPVDEKA